MKTLSVLAGLLFCLCLAGCSHTEQGLEKDTQQNEPKVAHALRKAGHEAAEATQKAAGNLQKDAGKAAAKTDEHNKKPAPTAKS